ncbi:MAG: gluconate 2-dehydrogenase alpha chain [Thermomicrobiales bacterium]|nr:gluconate 2-dehydrogenase alpha chain [Thermomicrobiales bacterium]
MRVLLSAAIITFNPHEARTAHAIFERLFPADDHGPGASEIGVLTYVDRALAGAYRNRSETYRLGLLALDRAARDLHASPFADVPPDQQDQLLSAMEQGNLPHFDTPPQQDFFALLRAHCQEGLFADPAYGGNRDKLGWRTLGHPGVWLENSLEESQSLDPVTKGGIIQSLADVGFALSGSQRADPEIPGYDPELSVQPPTGRADVVLVGVGGVGGYIAPILAKAGLKVVGLEAGPWRTLSDYIPDELGHTYYCRAEMGSKFMAEAPRWRTDDDCATQECSYSLGRMMNGVGGSIVHYGGWLRRFHPHHFRWRSHILERWGEPSLPAGCTVADWPFTYDELERYFTAAEQTVGIAGDETNPFITRSRPLAMPPLRPFRLGQLFRQGADALGLHPHPAPVGVNSVPYNGYPATTYSAWSNGFGAWDGDKWHPALTSVPEALATGNFQLRTHCRVLRVVTNAEGRATGVEYLDPNGRRHIQEAETVILAAYTFENVRLLFLSGDDRHPGGLGNSTGQLGKHVMIKQFAHVDGHFPHVIFNRHTGPASQAMILDDYVAESFDPVAEGGFIGGATLGAENQFLPIQMSRETLPPGVPGWGSAYKAHLRDWQHWGVVRIQTDALPYASNYLDLDPEHHETTGLGLPVMRITYDLRENELRQAEFFAAKADQVLRQMGAARTWRGPSFTGAASSHDLGGCRMSDDPALGVVDRHLRVHDTPGLYVFSGAVFPTCPGVNPTLTLWALCSLAADRLIERLKSGEETRP